jgi:hypothetical protein
MRRFAFIVFSFLALVVGVVAAGTQAPQVAPADLVLRGGRIITLDAQTPAAQALAARNGAIVAVGTDAAIAPYIGPNTQARPRSPDSSKVTATSTTSAKASSTWS